MRAVSDMDWAGAQKGAQSTGGLLEWAQAALVDANVADGRKEALFLVAWAVGCAPLEVYLKSADTITREKSEKLRKAIARRIAGEPSQYIIGEQEFRGRKFRVAPCVLIPRPETEELVDEALGILSNAKVRSPLVCDLGTGSGCIAVSIAIEAPGSRVVATDISIDALRLARTNAGVLGVIERIRFFEGDLFRAFDGRAGGAGRGGGGFEGSFDLIVSNPPYVRLMDLEGLQPEVRLHEPGVALLAGPDGLDVIRRIIDDAPRFLKRGGGLTMEVGCGQAGRVAGLLAGSGEFEEITVKKDLCGIERVVTARRSND